MVSSMWSASHFLTCHLPSRCRTRQTCGKKGADWGGAGEGVERQRHSCLQDARGNPASFNILLAAKVTIEGHAAWHCIHPSRLPSVGNLAPPPRAFNKTQCEASQEEKLRKCNTHHSSASQELYASHSPAEGFCVGRISSKAGRGPDHR